MKKIAAAGLSLILILSLYIPVRAYEIPSTVKIGLCKYFTEQSIIPIDNKTIELGKVSANGSFNSQATLITTKSYYIQPTNSVYFRLAEDFSDYSKASSAKDGYAISGFQSVLFYDGANWSVCLGSYANADAAIADAQTKGVDGTVLPASNGRISLSDNGSISIIFDISPQFKASSDFITLNGRKYRGVIEFGRYKSAKVTAVNIISLDDYLLSVLPAEMPVSWPIEALKAQAVAARSYTLTRLETHKADGYDLCDGSHCQNYIGQSYENERSTLAVAATSGILAYYEDMPINAVYSSSSGGHTEDSENVWSAFVPYLRGVPEINEIGAKEWTRSFTLSELNSLLMKNNISIGTLKSVSINKTTASGHVYELLFKGSSGTHSVFKDQIRSFFSESKDGSLESINFAIQDGSVEIVPNKVAVYGNDGNYEAEFKDLYVNGVNLNAYDQMAVLGSDGIKIYDKKDTIVNSGSDMITFVGKGWGHGVGMSQFGAKGMAGLGFTYIQILEYYYTGCTVK